MTDVTERVLPIATAALLDWPARTFPNRTAIVAGETRATFAECDARINRLANALFDLGLAENARVAVLIENSPQAVEARFAIMKAGLCMVPLYTRQSTAEQAEVAHHRMRSFLNFIARLRNDFLNEDHVIDENDVFVTSPP